MKYFPLKTALACLVIAPLLYMGTLQIFQNYFDAVYLRKVKNIFIGDTKILFEGRAAIEEQVAKNIYAFLNSDKMVRYAGLDLKITVTTKKGKFIYPTFINADAFLSSQEKKSDFDQIAKQNFDVLNQGLAVSVEIDLAHGSKMANLILMFCFGLALTFFMVFYKIGSSKAARERRRKNKLIDGLQKEEQTLKEVLENLEKERQGLFENIKALNAKYQKDKKKLKINEEELFDEIISLEEQLNSYIDLKKRKDEEIDELKSTIRKYERRKSSKNKRNEFDFVLKRFSALYKNINMNRKAVNGLLDLNEDQQIKAEEIILTLDQNPDQVVVKRKVFSGKKHKTTCLEVLFAYNGRLYFKKDEKNRVEVVVIGTKNTQTKDMDYLHNL